MGLLQKAADNTGKYAASVPNKVLATGKRQDPFRNSILSPNKQIDILRGNADGNGEDGGAGAGKYPEITRPQYAGLSDEAGNLDAKYRVGAEQAKYGQAGKSLISRATDTGESPWLKMQMEKQGLEQTNAMGNAAVQAQSQAAQARSNLAMRGGLSGGARERLASGAAQNAMMGQQQVANQGMQDRLGARISDEQIKTNLLGTAAGMENNMSQFNTGIRQGANQYNTQNLIGSRMGQGAFDMDLYKEQMRDRAAGRSADAVAASAPKKKNWWEIG
jgi:hypothetical protein